MFIRNYTEESPVELRGERFLNATPAVEGDPNSEWIVVEEFWDGSSGSYWGQATGSTVYAGEEQARDWVRDQSRALQ